MHEDHLKGLVGDVENTASKPNLTWDYGTIYCCTMTYRLMLLRFPNLKSYLVPLELDKEYVIDTMNTLDVPPGTKDLQIKIRMVDANHCPGSAMIILTGPLGTLLHTGDFRYNGTKMLQSIGLTKIDYMYLDNTFCVPDEDFPIQAVAYDKMVKIIKEKLEENKDY